ncbi:cytochrome c nitrite reductase, NrfD subunit [Edwardsiella tarda ATCC 23685]|uniref:Cytochrome c nitrite reductase, NrfD subunit n=1 Tax=Edwardsiella tarda ATCC 23685 TaxID=500638 RepID=D4F935_EDWTA|nr:cytochrome c nitrite reductase subunit NrfD [Edwardsiella tarda]EFE21714.1 cytochrome c nitrite reductase, NrfD subunit [Edwardsiella tarda ATCC 23685]GAC64515.1 NrfD protein [Edwardsiella tarda ATCC 15947 = NBRC 105688]STD41472.1 Formate-dependent nitrite reductase, membrane component [Edwardsiella tarda]
MTSPFHFPSLVWDWPIAVYLFLIGISSGLVVLAIVLRRSTPGAGESQSALMRVTLWLAPGSVMLGLLILIFHLARPWTFWKLMLHYSPTSVMSMGVMLFQVYMLALLLWLALVFHTELSALQHRWLPRAVWLPRWLARLHTALRPLETLLLVLAILLGAYTGFLLSALKSYPMLNHPLLPALFLFSGLSSGVAVALLASLGRWGHGEAGHRERRFLHRVEVPIVWLEIFLLAAFLVGLALGDEGKVRAFHSVVDGGFWSWWLWLGVVGVGMAAPQLVHAYRRWSEARRILWSAGLTLCGVLLLRFFVLYAGQLTVA